MRRLLPAVALLLATCGVARANGPTLVTAYIERGTAADGTPTGPGVAACPWWLAFGARVAIQGLGAFTCHDRYAAWLSSRFDCWMPTLAEAYAVTGYYEWEVAR